jgi:hypothetical protein
VVQVGSVGGKPQSFEMISAPCAWLLLARLARLFISRTVCFRSSHIFSFEARIIDRINDCKAKDGNE